MLVHYFVPLIYNNPYPLFKVSSRNSITIQKKTYVYINFFDQKYLRNHFLQ
jgi:hypothetical protein